MRTRDRERFERKANELIRNLGATQDDGGYWHLETILGPLELRVEKHKGRKPGGPGSVFARFDDPQRATELTFCNPHSGKWNHHYFGGWTTPQALADLAFHLRRVAR